MTTSIEQQLLEIKKQMESLRIESTAQMKSVMDENRTGLELIRQLHQVEMESIEQQIRQLMSTIKIKIPKQPIQLQLGEGSGFVDATTRARDDEHHALQLTEGSELVKNEEYINLKYEYQAHFYGRQGGLFRLKIPSSRNEGIKIENVILNDPSNPLPHCMVLFSHRHNHNIYMVGRQIRYEIEHSDGVYVFDPTRFQKLPIQGHGILDQPKELHDSFKPMIQPSWIQSEDRIYLISVHNHTHYKHVPFCFQSFDLTRNNFETLKPPPFIEGRMGSVVGFFFLRGYIYLFIEQLSHMRRHFAFSFNPRSSQWTSHSLHDFEEGKIPIPSSCIGDVGLSHEFTDKSRIMVSLNVEGPAAYRVQPRDGLLRAYSYRRLDEIFIHEKYKTEDDYAHLHDIGQDKFCVVYRSRSVSLLIYLFKIDFDIEHRIQISPGKDSKTTSSQVLYSKKFEDSIPMWDLHFIDTLSLPSSTGNEGRYMAATSSVDKGLKKNCKDMAATSSVDKDLKKNRKGKSHRLRGDKKYRRLYINNVARDIAAAISDKEAKKKGKSNLGDHGRDGKNPTRGIKPRV